MRFKHLRSTESSTAENLYFCIYIYIRGKRIKDFWKKKRKEKIGERLERDTVSDVSASIMHKQAS